MITHSMNAASVYRSVGLQTKAASQDPYQLVVLMFETVLEDINKARGGIQQRDVLLKIKHIDRAIRIIQEGLRTSLDLDNGGELAGNLASLYEYAVVRLAQANAKNDEAILMEVASLIEPVLDAWKQIGPNADTQPDSSPQTLSPVVPSPVAAAPNVHPLPTTPRRPVGAYASVAAYGKSAVAAGV